MEREPLCDHFSRFPIFTNLVDFDETKISEKKNRKIRSPSELMDCALEQITIFYWSLSVDKWLLVSCQ